MQAVSLQRLLSVRGRRDPYPCYAELHRHGAVCRVDAAEDGYDYVVHGYDAVDAMLRDPAFAVIDAHDMDRRRAPWREHIALRTLYGSIFFTNGADHTRVRRQFAQVFTPRRVTLLRPAVVALINAGLDRFGRLGSGGRPVDFMREFALRLPSDVVAEMLGVPPEDRAWFPPRVIAIGAILELGKGTWMHLSKADAAARELTGYFAELAAKRRAEPREDLISQLVGPQADQPGQLTDGELVNNLVALFNAGFVTTTHLLGNGLVLLVQHPRLAAALRADPDLAPGYVNEILRFEPPVHFAIRNTTMDTEVAGVRMPAGSKVLALFGAANRDPHRFPDPDRFDPYREHGQPLSFGGGPHYCLGAALSRLEGELALPMLLRCFPRLALAGAPGERSQLVLRGYDTLPVTVG